MARKLSVVIVFVAATIVVAAEPVVASEPEFGAMLYYRLPIGGGGDSSNNRGRFGIATGLRSGGPAYDLAGPFGSAPMLDLSTDLRGSRLVQVHGVSVAQGEPGSAMRSTWTGGGKWGKFSGMPWWAWGAIGAGALVGASCLFENWPCEDDPNRRSSSSDLEPELPEPEA